MIIKRIVVGLLETNCYIVVDEKTKEAVIIDPGDEPEKIFNAIKENGLKPKFILLTHKHPDHIGALKDMENVLDIKDDKVGPWQLEGPTLSLGNLKIKVIETPGHSEESVCFIIGKNIFSGDTLFKGGIGRTDLEGGDYNEIKKSLKRLMDFPDYFKVFPGHGEETTIGKEKANNPFPVF